LLLVVPVHQVLGAATGQRAGAVLEHAVRREDTGRGAGRVGGRDVLVDLERLVGKGTVHRGRTDRAGTGDGQRRRREVHVVLRQTRQRDTARRYLRLVARGGGVRETVDTLPSTEEIVEAVVLLVDDDDVLDPVRA